MDTKTYPNSPTHQKSPPREVNCRKHGCYTWVRSPWLISSGTPSLLRYSPTSNRKAMVVACNYSNSNRQSPPTHPLPTQHDSENTCAVATLHRQSVCPADLLARRQDTAEQGPQHPHTFNSFRPQRPLTVNSFRPTLRKREKQDSQPKGHLLWPELAVHG